MITETIPQLETAHDILKGQKNPLEAFFTPKGVAVIGATEKVGSVGRTLFSNLLKTTFGGTVFPVNPKRDNILGVKAYPTVSAIPDPVDLAVVVTPATSVPNVIRECVQAKIHAAIVISAGFKELGAPGLELEAAVKKEAEQGEMRIIGPNCLGVMNPLSGFNATFATAIARPGNIGFISQSGALCTAILDWSFREHVGFSSFMSIGSMLDVDWGDLIYYLGNDPETKSIVLYMESIGNARSFLSAAREVALTKPIIVIKAGRTEAAAQAAASHTGSLAGSDAVLDAAFRRCGVLRVDRISDLFYMSEVLAKQPRPRGSKLTILTNAGGPGVLATDALIQDGGKLAPLADETKQALNGFLPPHWSRQNPIDILGDAGPDRYAKALEIAAQDPTSDGLLVILTPQAMTDPTATAEELAPLAHRTGKPILASWMGGEEVSQGEILLNQAGIPTFPYPDSATRIFNYMWRYQKNLNRLYETPELTTESTTNDSAKKVATQLIEQVRAGGRTLLSESESKAILKGYDIPTVSTQVAKTEAEAIQLAEQIGYPVVLKLHSETITHKTEVEGVQLNLKNAADVTKAYQHILARVTALKGKEHFLGVSVQPMISASGYEIIIGSYQDAQFGPVILFGSGGKLVEVYKDRALGLPPFTNTLARDLMKQTKIWKALKGTRGEQPVDLQALEALLVRFSELVMEQPFIKEIDINPLLASPTQLIALDARIVLHESATTLKAIPAPAIRPYPTRYIGTWKTKQGTALTLRPIRPEDEQAIVHFHKQLSEQSVYARYFQQMALSERVAHERLTRICFTDYDREIALVAEKKDAGAEQPTIVGVGRLTKHHHFNEASFAILIADPYQKQGLGTELLQQLIQIAKDEKLDRLNAEMLADNHPMEHILKKLGFSFLDGTEPGKRKASLSLSPTS